MKYAVNGFSMIEVMIACALSLILLQAATQTYLISQKNHDTQQALARIQENEQLLQHAWTALMPQVGLLGCQSTRSGQILHVLTQQLNPDDLKAGDLISLDDDTLVIHHTEPLAAMLLEDMSVPSSSLVVERDVLDVKLGDVVLISDCTAADLITVTHLSNRQEKTLIGHDSSANRHSDVSKTYQYGAEVSVWKREEYSIKASSYQNTQYQAISTLYVDDSLSGLKGEWLLGVEALNIQLQRPIARFHWLFNSVDEVLDKPTSYLFNGEQQDTDDRLLRHELIQQIYLENW